MIKIFKELFFAGKRGFLYDSYLFKKKDALDIIAFPKFR